MGGSRDPSYAKDMFDLEVGALVPCVNLASAEADLLALDGTRPWGSSGFGLFFPLFMSSRPPRLCSFESRPECCSSGLWASGNHEAVSSPLRAGVASLILQGARS